MSKYNLPNIDVLKVGHHGSRTSSGKELINKMKPKYSIISVGKNNRYGHPDKEVLDNLDNSKIYRTDEDGNIMFKIKNNKLKKLDSSVCMKEYSKSNNYIILAFMIIPIAFILAAVININKVNKRIKIIMELNQTGKLIKNLPYRLENSDMVVNGVAIQRPVIDYTLPSGTTITLYGDARNDKKYFDADGMVDLLIDENNPNNYFIDFEINRLNGNLPQDYYQPMNQPNPINQYEQQNPNQQYNQQLNQNNL